MKIRLTAQHLKFGLVGIINTGIDIGIYTVLLIGGFAPITANIISTACGMAVSYLLNRRYTFRTHHADYRRQISRFLIVTLIGLWILQPVVIYVVRDAGSSLLHVSVKQVGLNLLAKLAATGVSLIWNYIWYSRHVFVATATPESAAKSNDFGDTDH